ncbi:MAG: glycosyltransferase [Gemmatimonadaceae bacterium]
MDMDTLPQEVARRLERMGSVDIVVGVPTCNNADTIPGVMDAVQAGLRNGFQNARSLIVQVDAGSRDGTVERAAESSPNGILLQLANALDGAPAVAVRPGMSAKASACRSVFAVAQRVRAKACTILDPDVEHPEGGSIAGLLQPVISEAYDFVAPVYARAKYAGTLTSGVVYPLLRALFGRRVRQPLAGDFTCSARLVDRFVTLDAWRTDAARAGVDLWVMTQSASVGARMCQVYLGPRKVRAARGRDPENAVRDTVTHVLGALFGVVERTESVWQKVRASQPVDAFGEATYVDDEAPPFDVMRALEAFRLGTANLHEIWSVALPPASLHALRKLARTEPNEFHMSDELWARVVYDFALAYHQRRVGREHLVGSFTPLYWAWLASFVKDVQGIAAQRAEERVEALCTRFETEKPYLISRWRWPDRFTP